MKNLSFTSVPAADQVKKRWNQRLGEGQFTRDENVLSHFCVYFAAYDPVKKLVFIGHHKKSGLWLFNGGHMDRDELPQETLEREMREEWGVQFSLEEIGDLKLLTITDIPDDQPIKCRVHYDMWYFVPVKSDTFKPDAAKLLEEFYENRWMSRHEALNVVRDKNTLQAIEMMVG